MIKIEHLKKTYPNATPLIDVNTEINDGDVIAVIGPSGTGKSTLLRCINLLEKPTAGHIWLDGEEITAHGCNISKVRQRMGMVFQSFNLFGNMTVIENIMFSPLKLRGVSRQQAYDKGVELLRKVGLADKALNYPDQLSGGQMQRVAIARALAMDPDTILLDEPTSALDPTMVGEVQSVIRDLARSGKTLMIVTHEMSFARAISNRVFYMDEGGIYEDGTPEQIFDNPSRPNTVRFIRRLKVLELKVDRADSDFPAMQGKIAEFCMSNQLPQRTTLRLQLAFEELVQQLLLPRLTQPDIDIAIEYSELDESVALNARYNGARVDITALGDELPVTVLKGIVTDLTYNWLEGEARPNAVSLRICN